MLTPTPRLATFSTATLALGVLLASSVGCGVSSPVGDTTSSAATTGAGGAGTGGAGGMAGTGGAGGDDTPPIYPACEGPTPMGAAFRDGPYGTSPRDVAEDFVVPTLDGDWSFKDQWTGCDSYVFVNYADGYPYSEGLWASANAKLLSASPTNVHYFFMSFSKDEAQVTVDVQKMKTKMDSALSKLTAEEQAAWGGRFHYVTTGAFDLPNWIGDMLQAKGVFAFAIDRFQLLREVGLLLNPGTGGQTGKLEYVANEAIHYNFEWAREQALLAEEQVTVVSVLEQSTTYDTEVTLPDAAAMAGFDTMEIDLTFACPDHADQNCGEWDYIANLFLCDVADPTQCPTEIARWITTYGREGRWVTDVSPMLAFLKDGGTRKFHLNPANSYVVDLSFRFSNRGKAGTPNEAKYLFSGGSFNQTYNDGYQPMTFDVPADVKRVEIVAYITGHGWGAELENCAEFCNHDHHFTVNGKDHVKDHPMAGTAKGCQDQIKDGVVPNQYGTWPLGRGGWCPGLDVKPWVIDITDDVTIGGTNTVTYKGLFEGMTYVPKPAVNPQGFGGNITMGSWLVYSR